MSYGILLSCLVIGRQMAGAVTNRTFSGLLHGFWEQVANSGESNRLNTSVPPKGLWLPWTTRPL
jgi:hypothetical protein